MKLLLSFLLVTVFPFQILAQCDNRKPMFGDKCVKSANARTADESFRKNALNKFGSADSASQHYLRLGWKNFKNGKETASMENLNQAWIINPNDAGVYFAFGHLVRFGFEKNAPEAEKYYQLGRNHDPNHAAEKESLARSLGVLEDQYDPQAMIDVSSQLIQSFPDYRNGLGYKVRAKYYTRMQMPDRAVKDWNDVLKLDPKDAGNYAGRGYAYYWLQDHKQALADYNQAISLDPEYAEAYANRAQLYTDSLINLNAALADIDKALKLAPEKPEFYRIKSNILFKQNRKTEACEFLKNGMAKGMKSLDDDYKERCGKK